jgi:tetratricopeptide (TPR) repeat protein
MIPAELRAVIGRCLEKDPVRRFQRTSEVQTALEAIQKGTVSPLVAWRYWLARHLGLVLAATVVVLAALLIGLNVGGLRERLGAARALYSHYLMFMKRPEEGMAEIQRALESDPLNGWFLTLHAALLEYTGRYDEAIVQFRKALRTSPGFPGAHWMLSIALFMKGLYEESLAEIKTYYAGDREVEEALTQGYAQSGYSGAIRRAADILAARARKTYGLPTDIAELYVLAGEKAQALEWLEKGLEVRDPNIPYFSVAPHFDALRSDPRFQDIVRRMKLPQMK